MKTNKIKIASRKDGKNEVILPYNLIYIEKFTGTFETYEFKNH